LIERIFKVVSSVSKIMGVARFLAFFNHSLGTEEFFNETAKSTANPAAYP
jgi:hypothetical protein